MSHQGERRMMTPPHNYLAVIKGRGYRWRRASTPSPNDRHGPQGVEFIAINTDAQAAVMSDAERQADVGPRFRLRAWARAQTRKSGARPPTAPRTRSKSCLRGSDMVFVTRAGGRHAEPVGRRWWQHRPQTRRIDRRCGYPAFLVRGQCVAAIKPRTASRRCAESCDSPSS